jgi:SpoVK/Ycf46/Vps4 family AAA+-type ATPase
LLSAILRGTETEQGFDYKQCARLTDGYTPSDITALCKSAMSVIINERKRAIKKKTGATIRHNSKVISSAKENKNSEKDIKKDTRDTDTDTDVPLRPLGVMVS